MRASARRIARALEGAARDREQRRGRPTYRAIVTRWQGTDDWRADLIGEDLDVDDEDVTLSRAVLKEHDDDPIKVGTVLVLLEVGDHEFSAVAVED